jgi:hypothetical protein
MHAPATQRSVERSAGLCRRMAQHMTWDYARIRTDGDTDSIELRESVDVL